MPSETHDEEELHEPEWGLGDAEWLARRFEELTSDLTVLSPSAWAEDRRYLPPSLTSLPGFYSFDVTPYLREIIDSLSVHSPVREVSVQKGAQVGVTVGVLENAIGYFIDHVATAPILFVTADAELAKQRLETNIQPMIQHAGLDELIKSGDEKNRRKSGQTAKRIEWKGGGYLIPFGAKSANKLRSVSIQVLLRDEIDGWPTTVGKDGDPIKLSMARTAAYEASRKVLDLSTPLIKGQSKIERRYAAGDQRKYFVHCLGCGHPQALRWRHTDPDTGEVAGIIWELDDDGNLVADSVRYACVACGYRHQNAEKTKLLAPDNAGWQPTATPTSPHHRSYHLSALYSPVGMQSWEACVRQWLDAWDEKRGAPKDLGLLQVFYNNVLGETFELRGEKLKFERVSGHRRSEYALGTVPNEMAKRICGSPVALLTAAVDVHKRELAVSVFGWCRGRRAVLIDYWRWEGDTEQLDDPGTWARVRELVESAEYVADDGTKYRIEITLLDSSYRTDIVYRFAGEYAAGVFPIKGRDTVPKNAAVKHFSAFKTSTGITAFSITVSLFKERWSAALRRSWDGLDLQPAPFFNAPRDTSDKQLRELTVETKREKIDARTGQRVGFEWHRPSGAANELWDLLVYNDAALELAAWDISQRELGQGFVDMEAFFDLAIDRQLYFTSG